MGIVVFLFAAVSGTLCLFANRAIMTSFQLHPDQNRIRLQPLAPARGYIYDRNGVLLADNYPVFTATMSRADVTDIDDTIERLTPILELTPRRYRSL